MLPSKKAVSGLIFVALLALLVNWLAASSVAQQLKLSALTIAILLGIALGNSIYPKISAPLHDGVNYAKGMILRLGIILYGFRITLQDINNVGLNAVAADAIMLTSTFLLAVWLGVRWLKMDKQTVYLTGAGCGICGAAAVMATEPVVKAESHKVSVAIAVVVIFGTLSMLLYPVLYPYLNQFIDAHQFGIYIGSTVHEVAQVYAAGGNINPTVADTAVISKMIRVMLLAPFLFALSYYLAKQEQQENGQKLIVPWFALLFIAMALINSLGWLPAGWVQVLVALDSFLLMSAMVALGLTTHISAIKNAGLKPILLGTGIYLWLVAGGFLVNFCLSKLL